MREKLLRDLNTVRADFEAWRAQRSGRERIPDALWAAAVGLLEHYPFGVVCRTLRLSPRDLRQRRAAAGHAPSRPRHGPSAFLELTAQDLATAGTVTKNGGSAHAMPPTASTCDVVVEHSDGSRLRLRLPVDWSHIEALCARFLGRV
jgi:hypothetical protein